jgi:hypothetical protein
MDEERFPVVEEWRRMTYASSRFKQKVAFVRYVDANTEVFVEEIIGEQIGKVVDIDNDVRKSSLSDALDDVPDKRFPVHFDKGFGTVVRKGLEPRSKSGGKYHGFHKDRVGLCGVYCITKVDCLSRIEGL